MTVMSSLKPLKNTALALGEVIDLLRRAERAGADPAEILLRARTPYKLVDLVNGQPVLIAARHLVSIYRECVVAIGWHSSRGDSKPQMQPAEFRLMCHCIVTAPNLHEAIKRQQTFFETRAVRISAIRLSITDGPARVTVDTLRRRRSYGGFLSDMVGMLAFSRFYAWLLGVDEELFKVGLAHSSRFANEALTGFTGNHIGFDYSVNEIAFPARLLDQPIVRSPPDLERLLQSFPFDFLSHQLTSLPLKERVRAIYALRITQMEPLPSLEEIAAETGQSVSTFRRRLAEEQTSVQRLKDAVRRDAALVALTLDAKVEDVARLVGFRDVDCFRAAFRRWTGTVPTQKRRGG